MAVLFNSELYAYVSNKPFNISFFKMQRLLLEDFIRRFETRNLILMGMQSFPNNISGCYLKRIEQAECFHSTPYNKNIILKGYLSRICCLFSTGLLAVN